MMKIFKILLLLSILTLSSIYSQAFEPIKVLHISIYAFDELQILVEKVNAQKYFEITQVRIDQGLPQDWQSFDVLVFGLSDCYESKYNDLLPDPKSLKEYVENGGAIIWTHDSLEYGKSWGDDIEIPAGVFQVNAPKIGMNIGKIRIKKDHPILHFPFEIGNVGDIFTTTELKGFPHSGGGVVKNADIIIEHLAKSSPFNFYLTVNSFGKGRVVVDEIGHSIISYKGDLNFNVSPIEAKILVNAIFWAAKRNPLTPLKTQILK